MKRFALLIVVLVASVGVSAQYRSKNKQSDQRSLRDKLYFAGGGGFGSGTNVNGYRYNYFSLLPTLGYRVKPELLLGANVSYSKYSFPDYGISYDQFGVAPFVRYYIQQLFFQLEYDKISSTTLDNQPRRFYDRLLVGIGYSQPIGKRGAINAMGLYDLLYQQNGVFQSPFVFRVFFSF
ncbi:MAG TPA: hypothetical protein VKQ08_06790 [Cyclobacteriaceae bacterium]|nr:hypothetical protein [Cyclobacteriaceae bacterium]